MNSTATSDDHWYELDIVDTAGIDELKNLWDLAIKNKDTFIFVYSLTSLSSQEKLIEYLKVIKSEVQTSSKVPVLIVGNKSDMINNPN